LDFVGAVLLAELGGAVDGGAGSGAPVDRAARAVEAYLDAIVEHRAFARLFLVEVHAAGPEAMARRAALQARVVDGLAALLGARSAEARFASQAFVAAVASLVALPLVTADDAAIESLRDPLVAHLRTLATTFP